MARRSSPSGPSYRLGFTTALRCPLGRIGARSSRRWRRPARRPVAQPSPLSLLIWSTTQRMPCSPSELRVRSHILTNPCVRTPPSSARCCVSTTTHGALRACAMVRWHTIARCIRLDGTLEGVVETRQALTKHLPIPPGPPEPPGTPALTRARNSVVSDRRVPAASATARALPARRRQA